MVFGSLTASLSVDDLGEKPVIMARLTRRRGESEPSSGLVVILSLISTSLDDDDDSDGRKADDFLTENGRFKLPLEARRSSDPNVATGMRLPGISLTGLGGPESTTMTDWGLRSLLLVFRR